MMNEKTIKIAKEVAVGVGKLVMEVALPLAMNHYANKKLDAKIAKGIAEALTKVDKES